MRGFLAVFRNLWRRQRLERDLDDELAANLETLEARLVAGGLDPAEARRRARIRLGGIEPVKERVRATRGGARLELLAAELGYAVRRLRNDAGLTAIVVATLGLGVASSVSVFSVVDTTLLSGLPYPDSEEMVFVWTDLESGYRRAPLSGPELEDMRQADGIAELGGIWSTTSELSGDGAEPLLVRLGMVTADFFPVLGVDPALGRLFAPDEEGSGAAVVLLSHSVWQGRFGADPAIVGSSIHLDGQAVEVVGVMPAGFRLWLPPDSSVPADQDAWIPFQEPVADWGRGLGFLRCVGRLAPGTGIRQLNEELSGLSRELVARYSEYTSSERIFYAIPLESESVRSFRTALLLVLAGGVLVLLITCVNSAGLLIGRALRQQARAAMRMALGATPRRLLLQALAEGGVLAGLGGLAGLALTAALLRLLTALQPPSLAPYELSRLEPAALVFGLVVVVFCTVVFCLVPSLETLRTRPVQALSRQGRSLGSALGRRSRAALVAAEVALGVVVLVGAGLLGQTIMRLQGVDPGYRVEGALTFKVSLSRQRYPSVRDQGEIVRRLVESIRSLPAVEQAGAVSILPLDKLPNWSSGYTWRDAPRLDQRPEADMRAATPGYLATAGATLIEGRDFTEFDTVGQRPVAIVDELLARRITDGWPARSALGAQIEVDFMGEGGQFERRWADIVGVVRHMRHHELRSRVRDQVFLPYSQSPRAAVGFIVRSPMEPSSLTAQIRQEAARLDPDLPIAGVRPFETYVADSLAELRFVFLLSGGFAVVGLILCCLGVYGVVSYSVGERRAEIGVRLAMGATPRQVCRQVLSEGLLLTGAGLAAGLLLALVLSSAIAGLLFGIAAADPATYAAAALVLVGVSVVASLQPARRAASVDPLSLLR